MKVLIINPGATSTKIAVFDEEEQLFKKSIDHSAQELDRFDRVIDQVENLSVSGYNVSICRTKKTWNLSIRDEGENKLCFQKTSESTWVPPTPWFS